MPYDGRFADAHDRVAAVIRERADLLDGASASLLHADLRRENLLLADEDDAAGQNGDGRPGILDWEWSLVGDPALHLCWAEDRVVERADVPEDERDPLRTALRDGYREVTGRLPNGFDRRRPVYRVVTFLPTVRSFHLWAPDAPEPTEELAAWVGSEFDARIEAARETRPRGR